MTDVQPSNQIVRAVTLWLDPVCPFSWNTARWLKAASEKAGFSIELRLMSLAELNQGRELPPPQQQRMSDSRLVGRLMAALRDGSGPDAMATAYFTFGRQYFDRSAPVDGQLVDHVVRATGAQHITAAVLNDVGLDDVIRQSHESSQNALGDVGGSPLITIGAHTAFGPVLTAVPDPEYTMSVFDAVTTLVSTPQFAQLERPRTHPST